jgi:hypothetical protein
VNPTPVTRGVCNFDSPRLGYCGTVPTVQVERWQQEREELYERQDRDTIRAYFDLGADPISEAAEGIAETEAAKEQDPVTAVDRWEWAQVAWCELDTSRLHMMTAEERYRHTEPVQRYVNARAFEKRFKKWVDGGCQFEKGSE